MTGRSIIQRASASRWATTYYTRIWRAYRTKCLLLWKCGCTPISDSRHKPTVMMWPSLCLIAQSIIVIILNQFAYPKKTPISSAGCHTWPAGEHSKLVRSKYLSILCMLSIEETWINVCLLLQSIRIQTQTQSLATRPRPSHREPIVRKLASPAGHQY